MLQTKLDPNIQIVSAENAKDIYDYGIEFTTKEVSIAQYMERPTVYITNDPIQRNTDRWSDEKASELVLSIIERVKMGPIRVQKVTNTIQKRANFIVIDGAQRLTNIRRFRRNELKLSKLKYLVRDGEDKIKFDDNGKPVIVEGLFVSSFDEEGNQTYVDISGLTFKDLPPTFQKRFDAEMLNIELYEFDSEEIKKILFTRWNNGEALTRAEKRKSKMSDHLLVGQAELKQMNIFKIGLSALKLSADEQSHSVLQVMAVIHTDNKTGLGHDDIDAIMDQFSPELIEQTKAAGDYLGQVYDVIQKKNLKKSIFNKIFNKTKMISMMYVIAKEFERLPTPEEFANWAEEFYGSDIEQTNFDSSSSTSRSDKVRVRNAIPYGHFKKRFSLQAVE
jgi:hypothetical protein